MKEQQPGQWKGTERETRRLLKAIEHNCGCSYSDGKRTTVCGAHTLAIGTQRELDHLLFAKRIAGKFIKNEFTPDIRRRI